MSRETRSPFDNNLPFVEPSDVQLFQQYRRPDNEHVRQEAVAELYRRYSPKLARLLLPILKDANAVDDAVQNTFVRICLRAHTFDFGRGTTFAAWLMAIARREAINLHRQTRTQRRRQFVFASRINEGIFLDDETSLESPTAPRAVSLVVRSFAKLPSNQRLAVFLHRFTDLKLREVSGLMQVPSGTAGRLIHQAKQRLCAAWAEGGLAISESPPCETGGHDAGDALNAAMLKQWQRLRRDRQAKSARRQAKKLGLLGKWRQIETRLTSPESWR